MISLNIRQIDILHCLLAKGTEVDAEFLAKRFDVSEKTIRNDLEVIGNLIECDACCIVKRRGAFYLQVNDFNEYKKIEEQISENFCGNFFLNQYEGQYFFLLKNVLFVKTRFRFENVLEQMYISETSLYKLHKQISQDAEKYGISWTTKRNHGVSVVGSERSKREFFVTKVNELRARFPNSVYSELIGFYLPYYQVVKESILEVLSYHKYYVSDSSLEILSTYVATAIERISNGCMLEEDEEMSKEARSHHRTSHIVSDIMRLLTNHFSLKYPQTEEDYIVLLIIGNSELFFPYSVNTKTKNIVLEILSAIEKKYYINLANDEKTVRDLEFIISCNIDKKVNISAKDRAHDVFKSSNPYEHMLAYYFYTLLKKRYDIHLSNNERSRLAAVICACLFKNSPLQDHKHFLMVTSFNYSYVLLLEEMIRHHVCPNTTFDVAGTSEINWNIDLLDYTLILTTELDYYQKNRHAVYIGNFESLMEEQGGYNRILFALSGFSKQSEFVGCFDEKRFSYVKKGSGPSDLTKEEYQKQLNKAYRYALDDIAYLNAPTMIMNHFTQDSQLKVRVIIHEEPILIDKLHQIRYVYILSYNPALQNMYYILRVLNPIFKSVADAENICDFLSFMHIVNSVASEIGV